MKKILIIFLYIIVFIISSCSQPKLENINIDELYNINEETYFVFFYKDDCSACEATLPTIKEYIKKIKKGNLIPLYLCNLSLENNSYLFRADPKLNGQGNNGKTLIDGAISYDELYISSTPTLIIIKTEQIKVSYFIASGKTNIINYFNDYEKLPKNG